VRYRLGRIHTVPNALSYLLGNIETPKLTLTEETLDPTAYYVTLVKVAPDFKDRLRDTYKREEC